MTTYQGKRIAGRAEVTKRVDGVEQPFPTRTDIRNHSPDGFNWGYGGSGPAQLALAIMADHLGPSDPPSECPFCLGKMSGPKCTNNEECGYDWDEDEAKWRSVNRFYQYFKTEVIASLPNEWTLTSEDIGAWFRKGILR